MLIKLARKKNEDVLEASNFSDDENEPLPGSVSNDSENLPLMHPDTWKISFHIIVKPKWSKV